MKEKVLEVKKMRGYYVVLLDSGETFKAPSPLLRAFPIKPEDYVEAEAYYATSSKEAKRFATERAAYLLEKKDYPMKQLHEKLTMVGYPDNIADEVLFFLISRGYVDDLRYARRYVEKKKDKTGTRRIRQELMLRGISKEYIEEALSELTDADEQLNVAVNYVKKYIRTRKTYEQVKLRNNAIAMLARRGYSYDISRRAYEIAVQSEE